MLKRRQWPKAFLIALAVIALYIFVIQPEMEESAKDGPIYPEKPHVIDQKESHNLIIGKSENNVASRKVSHSKQPQKRGKAIANSNLEHRDSSEYPGGIEPRGEIDANHLHGNKIGVRDDGTQSFRVVSYVSPGEETLEMKRVAHTRNCFNLKRSDSLALDRDIPDHRDTQCKTIKYPDDLPTSSVVFVFFNEPLSPLLRSIHSVLNRTPPKLLHEIVLVDDGSDVEWLKGELEGYVRLLPKTKIVRMPTRMGLMEARVQGAKASSGDTVTFLDSHIEVSPGWLEPLLARIHEDPHHVVMPIIDSIDADSFVYRKGGLDILGFSWGLGQKSIGSRRRSRTQPMPSPIMAGGLFSIDRKYFFELGAYDPEMRLYGGEEMEISFRIWQCGGTLECIPCSRVGHVFRTGQYWKGQVYTVPGDVIVRNKLRAAEVWMDEYKDIVKRVMSPLPRGKTLGPIDMMLDIRKRLNCKPFKWYLENVYPEMFVPNDPTFVVASGEIRNPHLNACFDTLGARHQGARIGAYPCHHAHGTQEFVLSKNGDIRVASMDFDNCLDRGNGDGSIGIWPCHQSGGNQYWRFDSRSGRLSDKDGHTCAEVVKEQTPVSPFKLILASCDLVKPEQKWVFKEYKAYDA
eukprot:gene9766-1967_t